VPRFPFRCLSSIHDHPQQPVAFTVIHSTNSKSLFFSPQAVLRGVYRKKPLDRVRDQSGIFFDASLLPYAALQLKIHFPEHPAPRTPQTPQKCGTPPGRPKGPFAPLGARTMRHRSWRTYFARRISYRQTLDSASQWLALIAQHPYHWLCPRSRPHKVGVAYDGRRCKNFLHNICVWLTGPFLAVDNFTRP
jgi:hypothetical protein